MKKILSTCLIIATLVGAIFTLTACKKDTGAPDGMQIVRAGSEYGYRLYAPEEWTVSNRGDIAGAYVSKLDSTSITFVKAEAPTVDIISYFHADMEKFPFEIKVDIEGKDYTFANATRAYQFTYSYDYDGAEVGVMQIFVYNGNDFYIFTYTSSHREREEGQSYYEFHLEQLNSIITSFEFIEKAGEPAAPKYETDANGNIIASDKKLCGFVMHVPPVYSVDYSSGIVSVTRDDGTNINLSETTYAASSIKDFWQHRKAAIEKIADKTVDDGGERVTSLTEISIGTDVSSEVDGVKWACAFEYTYSLSGNEYHVYQVLMNKGMKLYVFTYTASEANYTKHLEEAKKVLAETEF